MPHNQATFLLIFLPKSSNTLLLKKSSDAIVKRNAITLTA